MDTIQLKVSEVFTNIPGTREEIESDFSGEEFLEEHLSPMFKKALEENKILEIDLDGPAGYATSFLEAAFGGLVREYNSSEKIRKNIKLICKDDPFLIEDIEEYIEDALSK